MGGEGGAVEPVGVVANEFASVAVAVDHAGNGPRLRLEDLRTGRVGFLDALELETLAWLPDGGLHRLLDPGAERIEIPFAGSAMVGTLRRPRGGERAPLAVLLPGLDSTKEEFFEWENVFLERGLATFSLDGPGQGETGYTTYIHPNYEVAVTALLDHLKWDAPVGVVGVSLGGYYAPRAAAFEKRIVAAVGVSGAFCFGDVWDARPSLTKETFQHHSGASSPEEARAKAFELTLDGVAGQIDQPLLVIAGKLDRLVEWKESKKIADEAPNATWVMFDEGNHVCNNIPYKYRPLAADWLMEQLGPLLAG